MCVEDRIHSHYFFVTGCQMKDTSNITEFPPAKRQKKKKNVITILNTSYTLNSSDSKRAIVGVSLEGQFDPIIILENPRYADSKVLLNYIEWYQLCEQSIQINALFSQSPKHTVCVELDNHTIRRGDFANSIKIFNSDENLHMQEKTFRNLMYSSYAIDNAISQRIAWKPHIDRTHTKLMELVTERACSDLLRLSEEAVAGIYDSCSTLFTTDEPNIVQELRSYMCSYVYPTVCQGTK